jgi:hypothetical protein
MGPALESAQMRLVPNLVAGVRVSSDAGLVDASARRLASTAEQAVAAGVTHDLR